MKNNSFFKKILFAPLTFLLLILPYYAFGMYIHLPPNMIMSERSEVVDLLWNRKHDEDYQSKDGGIKSDDLKKALAPYKAYFEGAQLESCSAINTHRLVSYDILHICSSYDDIEAAQLLIEYGANVNGTEKNDRYDGLYASPLTAAILARNEDTKFASFLIENGADVDGIKNGLPCHWEGLNESSQDEECLNHDGNASPLYYAVYHDCYETISLLLNHGAKIPKSVRELILAKIDEESITTYRRRYGLGANSLPENYRSVYQKYHRIKSLFYINLSLKYDIFNAIDD